MIGVISGELARYADFSIALMHLQKPAGTKLAWAKGVDVAGNCNRLCRLDVDWLWLLGDDHVFSPDILARLLAHDVDVIVPLCLKRQAPFDPVVYQSEDDHSVYTVADLPLSGIAEVYAAGSAGMLIRRHVLEALEQPVFEAFGEQNEDLNFCRKVRDAGYKIWCDVDARLGHIGIVTVWPQPTVGGWGADLDLGNDHRVELQRIIEGPTPAAVASMP